MAEKGQRKQSQSQWQPSAESRTKFIDALKKHSRRPELFLRFKSLQPQEQAMLISFGEGGVDCLEEMFPGLKFSQSTPDPQVVKERQGKYSELLAALANIAPEAIAYFNQLPPHEKIALVELGVNAAPIVVRMLEEEKRKKKPLTPLTWEELMKDWK